jgi:hypothetical protein
LNIDDLSQDLIVKNIVKTFELAFFSDNPASRASFSAPGDSDLAYLTEGGNTLISSVVA